MSFVPQAKILLIKDLDDQGEIEQILLRYPFTLRTGSSGEFLAQISLFLPDLILLNARKCHELIAHLRAAPVPYYIPVLLVVDDLEQIEMAALEAGINDFLRKPIREAEVIARVRTLLALKAAGDGRTNIEKGIADKVAERTAMLESALRGQGALLSEAQDARRVWEATFNAMADAIVITDTAGHVTLVNSTASDFFHQAPEELIGQSCNALLVKGFTCPHGISSKERISDGQEVLSRAGDRLLNIRVSSFAGAHGQVYGHVHVIRDVTAQRVLERHLAQAERMSLAGLMVSAVAHEVATPLSVIANIGELLLMDVEADSPIASELNKIVLHARRVAEMMRRMLDFVRERPPQFAPVNVAGLARETLDLLKYELRKADIEIAIEADPDTSPVWGDPVQLQQVLLNIVTNAVQAMRDGGRLTVRVAEEDIPSEAGRFVLITVEDTGPGISPEALVRLFDFFFTTKTTEGGTGLGLAISRQIVEGHGGIIMAENNSRGGARISVRLPAAVGQGEQAPPRAGAIIRAQSPDHS